MITVRPPAPERAEEIRIRSPTSTEGAVKYVTTPPTHVATTTQL
jgi:hypothetical protein